MPSLEKHVQLSLKRTGKGYRELHEWLDSNRLGYKTRLVRHDIRKVPRFLPVVEKKFGKGGGKEYLQHLKDDYDSSVLLRALRRLLLLLSRLKHDKDKKGV